MKKDNKDEFSWQTAKDEFLKWVVPALMGALFYNSNQGLELAQQALNRQIATEEKVLNLERQQTAQVDNMQRITDEQKKQYGTLAQLQIKVFGKILFRED